MPGFLRTGKRRLASAALTLLPEGRTVLVVSGSNLLEAVLAAGVELAHRCGGHAECGSCHVIVWRGGRSLSKRRAAEKERLSDLDGAQVLSRLACQTQMGDRDVTIQVMNH